MPEFDLDLQSIQEARGLVAQAHEAQKQFARASQAEVDRIWRQRLERADFACDRARRQYQLAEPENRLVARQLEREWEAALAERANLGEEYERYQQQRPARLSPAELAAIRALASDIPALWTAPTTTVADRKRLIRAVISEITVTADKQARAAALTGLAPYDDDSGERSGARHISGGRERLRSALYAASLPASQLWNPQLVALYKRLVAAGKGHKVALVACARKLLIFVNTVVARGTPWIKHQGTLAGMIAGA